MILQILKFKREAVSFTAVVLWCGRAIRTSSPDSGGALSLINQSTCQSQKWSNSESNSDLSLSLSQFERALEWFKIGAISSLTHHTVCKRPRWRPLFIWIFNFYKRSRIAISLSLSLSSFKSRFFQWNWFAHLCSMSLLFASTKNRGQSILWIPRPFQISEDFPFGFPIWPYGFLWTKMTGQSKPPKLWRNPKKATIFVRTWPPLSRPTP